MADPGSAACVGRATRARLPPMGIFSSLRERRRAKAADAPAFGDAAWGSAFEGRPGLSRLGEADRAMLRRLAAAFAAEKRIMVPGGASAPDQFVAAVSALASLPILELSSSPGSLDALDWYRGWATILIVPGSYKVTRSFYDEAGTLHEYEDELAGEDSALGPVVLAAPDIEEAGRGEGYDVVIHEMAHKLDGLDFCCWECVEKFVDRRIKQDREYQEERLVKGGAK